MLQTKLKNWQYRYEKNCGENIWSDTSLLNSKQANYCISMAIENSQPFFAGKMGSNEQLLIFWSSQMPLKIMPGFKWRVPFSATVACATNAGVKPRNTASYHQFAELFIDDLITINLLGVFLLPREKILWQTFAPQALVCRNMNFTPFLSNYPWSKKLANKKVFIVSPFLDLFQQQITKRKEIWQGREEFLPYFDINGYHFPYLIDDKCSLNWQDVYQDVVKKMQSTDFDVALFGCGALGFLLAAEAKRLGKVGIHLGGFLQVMFGVAGARHQKHSLFKQFINSSWINPPKSHRPINYQKVEAGCYW